MICFGRDWPEPFKDCDVAINGFGVKQREAFERLRIDFESISFSVGTAVSLTSSIYRQNTYATTSADSFGSRKLSLIARLTLLGWWIGTT